MMKHRKFFVCNFIVSMLIGCLIYFFFRQDALISILENNFELFRYLRNVHYINTPNVGFWMFVKFYLPDLLWAYSLTFCAYLGFKSERSAILLPLISCIFIEVGQQLNFMSGTADVCDIAVEVLGILFALIVMNIYNKKIHKSNICCAQC